MVDQLPKQGTHEPWINQQDYVAERRKIRNRPIDDGVLVFSTINKAVPEKVLA